MIQSMLVALLLLLAIPAQAAPTQTCPAAATVTQLSRASVDEVLKQGMTATSEERSRMVKNARAHTILGWHYLGIDSLRQNKGGLSLLAGCMSAGGCGFPKMDATGVYAFINAGTESSFLRSPPPATAVQWAKEQLGCEAGALPAQTIHARTPSPAAVTKVLARKVPALVPSGPAPSNMAEVQASVEKIDLLCHKAPTSAVRQENCVMLGRSFSRGIQGYQFDSDSAAYYYKRACEEGAAGGCSYYGSHLRDVSKTDAEKLQGLEYVGKACDLGDEGACFNYKTWAGRARK